MTGAPLSQQPVNPLHLHIDCLQGISAKSFLDGLRILARTSGDTHAKDAFQIDPMSAAIWAQHIPDQDRTVLQDGSSVMNRENPVQSWEPFRKAIRDSPVEVSERVVRQLKQIVDEIEFFYDREVMKAAPLYPSVVWHMMAVILLLDRLRICTTTCSEVPRAANAPKVLTEVLKDLPEAKSNCENQVITTFDGAILLKVLKPNSPFAPDRVFHGKAIGRDAKGMIETVLGLTYQSLQVDGPKPGSPKSSTGQDQYQHKNIVYGGTQPPEAPRQVRKEQPQQQQQNIPSGGGTPPQKNGRNKKDVTTRQQQSPERAKPTASPELSVRAEGTKNNVGAPPQQYSPASEELTHRHDSRQYQPTEKSVLQGNAPPSDEKQIGILDSALWNVETDLTLLQTNIDDMTPEHLSFCAELLRQQGAADVWLTPIVMKKNRAAQELNILANDSKVETLLTILFRQTTTLGVRVWTSKAGLQRVTLRREIITIDYCRRPIQVKVAYLGKEPVSLKPEYEQCLKLAMDTQIPLMVVTEEVKALAKDHERRKLLALI